MAQSSPEAPSERPGILRDVGLGALVAAAALAAYLPALGGALIWNDVDYITAPALRSLHGLARIWTEPGATQQYYPLLHSAFWLEFRLWGDHPLGYHAVTVLLHAASSVLLALVLCRLYAGAPAGGDPRWAPGPAAGWLAALLFALHPVHVESVAWISEQKNTLSLALYLASALAYLRFDAGRRPGAYLAALALFVGSMLGKTVTATLPAALLVALWWKRGRLEWRRDVLPLLPWLALGAAAGLFSSWVERTYVGAQGGDFEVAPVARALVAGRAVWFYLGSLAWPFGLNFIYPRWAVDAAAGWQWLPLLGALGAGAALGWVRRRFRGPLAAYLFFVGSLFPALGFVNLYGERYSWVWDHWQYLPDLGPIALAAAGLTAGAALAGARLRRLGPALAGALALALGALTWAHCAMFHDNETLYLETLARNPGSWMAHNNLGLAWSKVPGRLDDAVAQYQAALRLKPDIAETHTNLGLALSELPGRLDEAVAQFGEALRLDPAYADAHFYLANALVRTGRVDEAVGHYEEALRLEPGLAEASNNLGMVLCRTGRAAEGMARIEAAIRMKPDFAQAHFARGAALLQAGRRDEAVAEYETVLRLRPGDPSARRMLEALGAPH